MRHIEKDKGGRGRRVTGQRQVRGKKEKQWLEKQRSVKLGGISATAAQHQEQPYSPLLPSVAVQDLYYNLQLHAFKVI